MASPFQVRPATADDHTFLVRANLGLARETEDLALDETVLRAGVARALADAGRARYFVAERDRATVGSLMITLEWSDWRDGWIWWIQSVYVVPEARRQGVYRALHGHVVEAARATGEVRLVRLYVDKHNARARSTYEAMGMSLGRYDLMEQAI